MSFNNVGGLVSLAPGQTVYWEYWWGGDQGTQMATADVKTPNDGAWHNAFDQRKRKDNNNNATYSVTIRNDGPGVCWHNLQGGGMA